jgi:Ferritin-like domain
VGSDTIAERMRALGATPDGRSATVAAMTRLPAYRHGEQHTTTVVRLVFGNATAAVATMRAIHDAVDAADPSTSDLLHALIVGPGEANVDARRAARGHVSTYTATACLLGTRRTGLCSGRTGRRGSAQQRGVPWT